MCKDGKDFKVIPADQPTELVLIMQAIDKLGGENAESAVAVIKELSKMKREQERWDAEKEFYSQLSEFQNECPQIRKTSSSKKSASREGGNFGYSYAELDEIQKTIKPRLYPRGFSFSWDTETIFENDKPLINCICYLRHRNGHLTKSSFSVPISKDVGSMNEVQRHSAIKTYIKRQTLVDVLGLTMTEKDTDGDPPGQLITKEELEVLTKTVTDSMPPSSLPRFLKLFKIKTLEELPQFDLEHAMKKLSQFKTKFEETE